MQLRKATQLFFAVTMMAIGLIGLFGGTFGPIWQPVPENQPDRQLLAYLCNFISLICGAGLLSKRAAFPAALALFAYYLIWTILFKGVFVLRAPLVEGTYQSLGESAVLIAAAWVLLVWSGRNKMGGILNFLAKDIGLRIAHVLYGLALVAFGLSHFVYLELTAPLVPAWLPDPVFWAYLTGSIYLAAGAAIVIGIAAPLGAAIAAVQITLITLLVWGPMVLNGHVAAFHWQETIVSWALTAGAWVVAASFEDRPWFYRLGRFRPMRGGGSTAGAG